MKKLLIVIVLLLFVLILFSCVNQRHAYPFAQSTEDIVQIELVEIAHYSYIQKGYFEGIVVKKIINCTEHEAFISEFQQLRCKKVVYGQGFVEGSAIRITYEDGGWELITYEAEFYCDANKNQSYPYYRFDQDDFEKMLTSWELQ